jgi:hypothetical protein
MHPRARSYPRGVSVLGGAQAYVMATQGLSCPKAFRVLKKKHKLSCPNEGFRAGE